MEKKKKKKKKDDDVDVDVAQRERSSIKRYASAFSNILIIIIEQSHISKFDIGLISVSEFSCNQPKKEKEKRSIGESCEMQGRFKLCKRELANRHENVSLNHGLLACLLVWCFHSTKQPFKIRP